MHENEMQQAVAVIEKQAVVKVASVEERGAALNLCKAIKARRSDVVAFFKDTKEKAHQTWKAIVAQEKGFTDRLDGAERKIKTAVMEYDRVQEAIRRDEQRRLQAIADEQARKERERLEKLAVSRKTFEVKEAYREQAAAVMAPVINLAPVAPKVEGVSVRKTWKARIVDATKVPREFMVVSEKALVAYAKATQGKMSVAGVEFYEQETMAVR